MTLRLNTLTGITFGLTALTTSVAFNAHAYEPGDFIIRAGITTVAPNDSTSGIEVAGTNTGITLAVDNNTQLGVNFAYFINQHINIELLAATPFSHDVSFTTPDPLGTGNQLASVKHLPPTLSANYYFNEPSSLWQFYVGAGVNYTLFFDESLTSANEAASLSDLKLANSFGLSAQAGLDYQIDKTWHVNASLRYIDIATDASFKVGNVSGKVASIDIDPWVYTLSLGYRF